MKRYSLTHLSNEVLGRELANKARNEKEATAELIAHIAEFDERKLYLPAAYESMFAYCVGELGLSEEAAAKRIFVARAARRCPEVFEALAEGRVHLSGLVLLARHLEPETAGELLAAATHKTKAEIEQLIAERFPRPEVSTRSPRRRSRLRPPNIPRGMWRTRIRKGLRSQFARPRSRSTPASPPFPPKPTPFNSPAAVLLTSASATSRTYSGTRSHEATSPRSTTGR